MTLDLRTRPVTEEEAAKIDCQETFNRPDGALPCRGQRCMSWRFVNHGVSGEYLHPVGYCGKAGQP